MTQRSYRRLTRILFLVLFLFFLLLFLLLQGKSSGRVGGQSGPNWIERTLPLGDVLVSEVRSGGFIVDEFPIPASTTLDSEDFNENIIVVTTSVYNTGTETVDVTPSIYGTKKVEGTELNPGLNCGFYHYSGDTDPANADIAAFLTGSGWNAILRGEKDLSLHVKDSAAFSLAPGETRHLVLFFWVDESRVPTLTDMERSAYSITVKLTSRAGG